MSSYVNVSAKPGYFCGICQSDEPGLWMAHDTADGLQHPSHRKCLEDYAKFIIENPKCYYCKASINTYRPLFFKAHSISLREKCSEVIKDLVYGAKIGIKTDISLFFAQRFLDATDLSDRLSMVVLVTSMVFFSRMDSRSSVVNFVTTVLQILYILFTDSPLPFIILPTMISIVAIFMGLLDRNIELAPEER